MENTNNPYEEGRNAWSAGDTTLDCPYNHGDHERDQWMEGYQDAHMDYVNGLEKFD
jgi:ribosome modulation factor